MDKTDKENQERSEIFAWLRGGDMTPDPEMEERFLEMVTEAVIARTGLRRRAVATVTSPLSLKALMKSSGIEDKEMPDIGSITPVPPKVEEVHVTSRKEGTGTNGWEIDSLMVAKTIVHLAYMENLTLSMSHIQMILYIAYGVWLARNHTDLFDEHPQVWQFGPVFPRVYSKFKRGFDDAVQVHDQMKSEHPVQLREQMLPQVCLGKGARSYADACRGRHSMDGHEEEESRQAWSPHRG